jgi:hypothetical protein
MSMKIPSIINYHSIMKLEFRKIVSYEKQKGFSKDKKIVKGFL